MRRHAFFLIHALACIALISMGPSVMAVQGDDASRNAQGSGDSSSKSVYRPFNGHDLAGWKLKRDEGSHWTVGRAELDPQNPGELKVDHAASGQLINAQAHGVDIYTERTFGDCTVRLEVMVPERSNSGIYLMGNYEIQVLDSFGREKIGPGDIGGIYGAAAPRVNAAKAPGKWQKFEVDFRAPRFDAKGQKIANARFERVILNGKVIQEDVEVAGPTGGNLGQGEGARGPLLFQGNHGPVAYRNIEIVGL